CPPEIGPKAYAPVSTVSPNASETPRRPIPTPGKDAASTALPHPPSTSQNVPRNSAASFVVIIPPPCVERRACTARLFRPPPQRCCTGRGSSQPSLRNGPGGKRLPPSRFVNVLMALIGAIAAQLLLARRHDRELASLS